MYKHNEVRNVHFCSTSGTILSFNPPSSGTGTISRQSCEGSSGALSLRIWVPRKLFLRSITEGGAAIVLHVGLTIKLLLFNCESSLSFAV